MRTMKVFPNPWGVHPCADDLCCRHGLSKHGYPSHAFMMEVRPGQSSRYVGAELDRKNTKVLPHADAEGDAKLGAKLGKNQDNHRSPPQVTVWNFAGVSGSDPDFCSKFIAAVQPVEVPAKAYYIRALQDGDLLPADEVSRSMVKYLFSKADFADLADRCCPKRRAKAEAESLAMTEKVKAEVAAEVKEEAAKKAESDQRAKLKADAEREAESDDPPLSAAVLVHTDPKPSAKPKKGNS